MKIKVSEKWTEQKNSRNANRKYINRGFKRSLPSDVSVDVTDVL